MTLHTRNRLLLYIALVALTLPLAGGLSAAAANRPASGATASYVMSKLQASAVRRVGSTGSMLHGDAEIADLPAPGVVYAALQQQATFADPAFQRTWERTDRPVAGGQVQRSWFWGPTANSPALQEDYAEGVGGKRLVQYFDKSRMEINNPNADKNSQFYVTNGLLTVELISGKMQTGNATYSDRYPADIPMASDSDDVNAPTYVSFQGVSNTPLGDHPATSRIGMPATATITRGGLVGDDPLKASYPKVNVAYFEPSTKHNIPQVMWEFLNDSGPIYNSANGQSANARLSDPWYYATGLPISEPYWANVKIAGQQQDVLIQAFERRVVTYTPNGVPGFKVQMGNIGQHYYDWRYKNAGHGIGPVGNPTATPSAPQAKPTATTVPATPTNAPPAAPDCSGVPAPQSATITPKCGPVGTVFAITIFGFTPNEPISYWITLPDGQVAGTPEPLDVGSYPGTLNDEFDSGILEGTPGVEGIWAISYQGADSKHLSIVRFKITPDPSATPGSAAATPTLPPGSTSCDGVPAPQNVQITPSNCAHAGTTFHFVGRGFSPNEKVGVYVTAPDQAVYGAPQQFDATSDGLVGVTFGTSADFPIGVWAMTMEGTQSHHKAIGYFKVTPP